VDPSATAKPKETRNSWLIMAAISFMGAGLLVIGVNAELHRWSPPPVPPAAARPAGGGRPRRHGSGGAAAAGRPRRCHCPCRSG